MYRKGALLSRSCKRPMRHFAENSLLFLIYCDMNKTRRRSGGGGGGRRIKCGIIFKFWEINNGVNDTQTRVGRFAPFALCPPLSTTSLPPPSVHKSSSTRGSPLARIPRGAARGETRKLLKKKKVSGIILESARLARRSRERRGRLSPSSDGSRNPAIDRSIETDRGVRPIMRGFGSAFYPIAYISRISRSAIAKRTSRSRRPV